MPDIPVGKDGFVHQGDPNTWYGDAAHLTLRGSGSSLQRRAFLWFPPPVPEGATVTSAVLRLGIRETAWTGQNLTVERITESWARPTWNEQPAVTNPVTQAITASPGETVDVTITSLIAAVASGANWYGLRLSLGPDVVRKLHSKESSTRQPLLIVEYTEPPDPPTDLRPSDARAVSLVRPTLTWAADDQTEAKVQVSETEDFAVVFWDSGWVATTDSQMTVGADLTDGSTYWWKVAIRNSAGSESAFSEPVEFNRRTKGTLAITSPGATTETSTPAIVHALTGRTQKAAEWQVFEERVLVAERPREATTDTSWTIPPGKLKKESVDVKVVIKVWDTISRETTPGDPQYVEAEHTFQFVRAAPNPPATLTVTATGPVPVLEFTRSAAPAYFAVRRDGILLSNRLDPADLLVSGTTYQYRDWGATPGEHTWEVGAVVDDAGVLKESTGNPTDTETVTITGVWVLSEALDLDALIVSDDLSATDAETADTLFPSGFPVRVSAGQRGVEGSVSGLLIQKEGRTGEAWRDRLRTIKKDATDTRLVWPGENIPVILGELSLPPMPGSVRRYQVSFEFWQSA